MQISKRKIAATISALALVELETVTDVLVDNRAIGYRATAVGGRDASFEPLAELIATHDLESSLSAALMDGELMNSVFDKLFPKKETLKLTAQQGMLTMPMLIKAFRTALPGDGPAKTVLSQIMAELTAHSIRHLNLVLPFDGIVSLSVHDAIFPHADTIIEAARVKRITDVLESMKLDPEIGRVKTLSAASLYSAMQPMFTRAGRLLLTTIEQDLYLRDTLYLLRLYVTNDPALPKPLLNNDDLRALSTNITYVLAAVAQPLRDIALPEYFLAQAISESALRLRELKRFSTKHISEVKQWYVHYCLYDHPGQQVVGLLFGRNVVLENRPQVTIFTQVESANHPMWTQVGFPVAENRVEPLLTQLYNTELKCQSLAALASGVATYLHDADTQENSVYFANGATEIELLHYAAASSRRIMLSMDESFGIAFMNEDVELNYRSLSQMMGTTVLSTDPAEAIIHSGLRENVGEGSVPSRIQGIPDTARHMLLLSNPESFAVNLGAPMEIAIELENDITLRCKTSLSELLVLPKQLRLSLTLPLAAHSVVDSHFGLMLDMAEEADLTAQTGQIARLRAATALSNMLLSVGASPAGRAMTRSVFIKLMQSVEDRSERERVRGKLRHATLAYKIAMMTGAKILTSLALLSEDHADAALSLIGVSGLETYMIGSIPNLSDLV